MRRRVLGAGLWLTAVALTAAAALDAGSLRVHIPDPPATFLHDGARVLSPSERTEIQHRLTALDRARLQIGVAILPSLEGEPLEDVSMAIAEKWAPGDRERDDGVLIAIFTEDRKIRIEVGYGLEDRITDAAAGRIIRGRMAPAFRSGAYALGILSAVDAIEALAGGRDLPPPARVRAPVEWVPLIVFLVLLLLVVIRARSRRSMWFDVTGWGSGSPRRRGRSTFGAGGWFGGGGGGGSGFGGGSFGGGGASGGW